MKKIKIIANPVSGREEALQKVMHLVKFLSKDQVEITLLFTHGTDDATRYAQQDHGEDLVIACGGDGTLHEVVNGLYYAKRRKPLAILPCGTVNDFANHLKLPHNVRRFYQMLLKGNTMDIDLGMAGERVFVNVAAGGHLTEIAYSVSDDTKAKFGNMAYYFEGAKELLKLRPFGQTDLIKLYVESEELQGEEEVLVFIIANSASVGGFKKLAPRAEVFDGYLDVLMLKELEPLDVPELIASLLNGNHVDHNKIIYIKTKEIQIKSDRQVNLDLDGERAGELPMTFKVLEKALTLIVN
ncbi:MAG: diacylglycerol kinase family lipid kinase [Tissierellia bacterium]|nr:diacylglycerol kinase family lipid kinase [Tissierellia bacterium]